MDQAANARNEPSLREQVRIRHHARARAVAEGRTPEGSKTTLAILAADPAFQNLVSLYRRGAVP